MDRVSPPLCTGSNISKQALLEKKKSRRPQHSVRFSNEIECKSPMVASDGGDSSGQFETEAQEGEKGTTTADAKPKDEPKTVGALKFMEKDLCGVQPRAGVNSKFVI